MYFAIDEVGQVAYIGQSVNIRQRWRAHHVQGDLCDLSDLHSARRVRVAWMQVEKAELDRVEAELIKRFKPRLNVTHVPVEPKQKAIRVAPERTSAMAKKRAEKMLTVKEAAEKIGASSISVRIWASRGRFPGAVLDTSSPRGAVWMIPETSLEGFQMGSAGRPPKPKAESKKGK